MKKGLSDEYTLIGFPLGYSLSPRLHNAFFNKYAIQASYGSTALQENELEAFVTKKEYQGFNVTVPYKEAIIPFLDEITSVASEIEAVNTVKFSNDIYIGTNTDAPGFSLMLKEEANLTLNNKNILLLGAGGAAKAICYSSLYDSCQNLFIYDLSIDKTNNLIKQYKQNSKIIAINSLNDLSKHLSNLDLVINATPVGMKDSINQSVLSSLELALLPERCYVVDIIYAPLQTRLLALAEARGLRTMNGIGMLAGQGILAQEFWFNLSLTYKEAKDILLNGL